MGLFNFFRGKKAPIQKGAREQRTLPRWKISAPAKIKLACNNDYFACEVKDLNFRGFCLVMADKIPEDCFGCELYFNDNYSFSVGITVTWHKEAGDKYLYGVKFTKLRDQDKEKIFQMMRERFPTHFRSNL